MRSPRPTSDTSSINSQRLKVWVVTGSVYPAAGVHFDNLERLGLITVRRTDPELQQLAREINQRERRAATQLPRTSGGYPRPRALQVGQGGNSAGISYLGRSFHAACTAPGRGSV